MHNIIITEGNNPFSLNEAPQLCTRIGKGAYSEVWQGKITENDGQLFAIKVIDKTKTDHKYIEREINTLERLSDGSSDHVIQLKGYYECASHF